MARGRAIEEKKREGGKSRERQVEQRDMKTKMSLTMFRKTVTDEEEGVSGQRLYLPFSVSKLPCLCDSALSTKIPHFWQNK